MSSFKTDSGIAECRKTEDGICDTGGGMGSGITSINGSTVSAQSIVGGTNINVSSIGGTTTIAAVGAAAGTVTGMTAPQMFTSPVVETGLGVLQLSYSGVPMALASSSNGLLESTQQNNSSGALAESGFAGENDQGDLMEIIMSGSGNTRRGIIRSASSAFGMDINQQGSGKNIKLQTNSITRTTIDDSGLNASIGNTTPNSIIATTVTALTPITVTSGGTGTSTNTAHYILVGEGTSAISGIAPSTAGFVLTSNGGGSDPSFQSAASITYPITVDKGGTGLTSLTAHNVVVGEGTSVVSLVPPSTSGYVLTSNGSSSDPSFQPQTGASINQVVFQGTSTSTQSISNSTATQVTGWSSDIDTATAFATNTYTIPFTGYYKVEATIVFATSFANFNGNIYIYVNGTPLLTGYWNHSSITGLTTLMVQGVINAAASDLITVYVQQNTGGALAIQGTAVDTNWTVTSIGGQNSGGGGSGSVSSVSASSSLTGLAVSVTNPTTTPAIAISYSGTPFLVADGGTGTTTSTGSGSVVLSVSPALVTPALGTPQSGVMTNVTGTASGLTSGSANNVVGGSSAAIIYQSSTGVTAFLSNGSSGQVLQSNGGASAPSWGSSGTNLLTTNNIWTGTNQWNNVSYIEQNLAVNSLGSGSGAITLASGANLIALSGSAISIRSGSSITSNSGASVALNGTTNISGLFLLTGSAGGIGQVLQSNGIGVAPSWVSQLNIFATNNTWTGTNTWQNTSTNNGSLVNNGTTTLTNQLICNGTAGLAGQFLVSQG